MQTQDVTPTRDSVVEIRQLNEELINLRGEAIHVAHRCGTLLAEIANKQGELFSEWLAENLPEIPTGRVVNLIQLSARALPEGDSISRQFLLKLADESEILSERNPSIQLEPHVLFVNRICQWFAKQSKKNPVESWAVADRARLKRELEPLAKIYEAL